LAREGDGEDKKRGAQCCRYGHQEGSPATAIHGESFALPPNGLRVSGERMRVRCTRVLDDGENEVCRNGAEARGTRQRVLPGASNRGALDGEDFTPHFLPGGRLTGCGSAARASASAAAAGSAAKPSRRLLGRSEAPFLGCRPIQFSDALLAIKFLTGVLLPD
jgi:hypothetical protein